MYTWMIVLGIAFTFLMTVLGASLVFCFKKDVSSKLNTAFLGIASGIMLAASMWSLLLPALEQAEKDFGKTAFLPVAIGFLLGGALLVLLEKITLILKNEGGRYSFTDETSKKSGRLFLAVTLHNIPEGLAVGFAFGAAAMSGTLAGYTTALGLAIGMGIQNFPEGAAVALPMRNGLRSNKKAFFYGVASGIGDRFFPCSVADVATVALVVCCGSDDLRCLGRFITRYPRGSKNGRVGYDARFRSDDGV